jgi:A/G-specific adenine glycosylase
MARTGNKARTGNMATTGENARTDAPERLQHALLTWADAHTRDLPWRRTRDPWAVLVSELMLQQTQVARVLPRYEHFLDRFPTPAACAAVPAAEVVRMWAGLGYNRRALHLHRAAVAVAARHGGHLPGTLAELLRLPGVGPYIARAVLAFAFDRDVAILDANAARALSRTLGRAVDQPSADALVPPGRGWAWNQAVLDLGATVCRSLPRCAACPLAGVGACAWQRTGRREPDPWPRGPRQPRFEGSDRQGRGRLVAALRSGPVDWPRVAAAAGWPDDPERARRVAGALLTDGLAVEAAGRLRLP